MILLDWRQGRPNPEADYDWTGLCPRGLHVAHEGECPGEGLL